MDPEPVEFNGIDARTGRYLFPPMEVADVAKLARTADSKTAFFRRMSHRSRSDEAHFGVLFSDNPDDLAQTGWGAVFPETVAPDVRAALEPLLELRRDQAGDRYREFTVRSGESASDFLGRHGMGPDPADPDVVPYYLLLVGPPTEISFTFQSVLDVQYAVGRVDFDTAAEYGAYAQTVRDSESRPTAAAAVHVFGTRNQGDMATALSASRLATPLAEALVARSTDGATITSDIGEPATKHRLAELLADGPSVLFTATHGLGGEHGAIRNVQGALVCQDWPGPLVRGPVNPGQYLCAADVGAPVAPRVVFSFACYSAGYPDQPYVAQLPKRLLSRGLLGFVGHVDRAWGYSFLWNGARPQITAMVATVLDIHQGHRIGHAMEALNARWASIATQLATLVSAIRTDDKIVDDHLLAWLWTASDDARNYVILGDPAVRAC
jgi:hypothetical protein